MVDNISPIEIAKDTFWVGKRDENELLHANPYIRVFKGESGGIGQSGQFNFLIDPGSQSDFAIVGQKINQAIGGMQNISAIFINHQDPDVGSITPKILARYAPKASVVCSESTYRLARHTGLTRKNLISTDRAKSGRLVLPTGHKLQLIPTPYVHTVGAVAIYDAETRVLFTGDFFGGLSEKEPGRIEATVDDWKGIRAFHQIYMPSMSANRKAIDAIRKLDPFPEIIAPQHGYIARGELIKEWLDRMYHLPCGLDIMDEDDGDTLDGWNSVLERVLVVSRTMLGANVDARIADDKELENYLTFDSGQPKITTLGRIAIEKLVVLITRGEPDSIGNVIKMEAINSADLADLPTPNLPIENMGNTFEDFERDRPVLE